MKRIVLFAALAALAAFALYLLIGAEKSSQSQNREQIEVEGFKVTLSAPEGSCRLAFSGGQGQGLGTVALDVPPPCRFVRNAKGETLFSSDDGRQLVAVIGGTPEEDPVDPLTSRPDCGTAMAGVEYEGGRFAASSYVMGPGVYCAQMGLEGREIWLFLNG